MINEESHLDVLHSGEQKMCDVGENRPYLVESNNLATAILSDIRKLSALSEEQLTSEEKDTLQT